ncbi:MAG: FAD-dependent oxidoreductase [Candidatus Pacebacteria bacterium]|nr:FAD-dependent oxidoreductase [Candidatus Paceibacterota bacterium]
MIYDLIIIGGGPGGITSGIYAGRQGLKTLLITKDFGGQIAKKGINIENWPGNKSISGQQLIKNFVDHLKEQKEVEIKFSSVIKVEKDNKNFIVLTSDNKKFKSLSVIIAIGTELKHLNILGEEKFKGRGVSYCSICDGPLFKNKNVAVIGGGNSGFETSLFLSKYAKKIYILEYFSNVNADKKNQELVKKNKKIKIITNAKVKEIKGNNFVEELVYDDLKDKKTKRLKIEGVFIQIGCEPKTSIVESLVDLNEKKEIEVNHFNLQTKTPGLFAIGDVNSGKYKQIVIAAGEGAKATLFACQYLKENKLS